MFITVDDKIFSCSILNCMVIVLTLYPVHIQVLISIMKHVLAAGFPTSFESWFMSPDGGGDGTGATLKERTKNANGAH